LRIPSPKPILFGENWIVSSHNHYHIRRMTAAVTIERQL
jgi:hypothetical protein